MSPRKLSEMQLGATISGLWKGTHGSGKTIASCSKLFRPCYTMDFENRMESVCNYYRSLGDDCSGIEYDYFPLGGNFYAVNKRFDELLHNCPYKSVNVASLTSYIHYILKATILAKSGTTRSSGQSAGKSIGGIPVNELEDFNAEDAAIIFELLEMFQQLKSKGINVFLEAHISPYELRTTDKSGTKVETIMQILTKGKKSPAQIPGYFNEIYLFQKEVESTFNGSGNVKYTVNPVGDRMNDCKTSLGIKSFDWTNKDFGEELFKQISSEIKEAPRSDPNAPVLGTW